MEVSDGRHHAIWIGGEDQNIGHRNRDQRNGGADSGLGVDEGPDPLFFEGNVDPLLRDERIL